MENYQEKLLIEKEAIKNCEKERIHDIDYIQPFGYLIAVDIKNFIVTHVSENFSTWFGLPISEILNVPLQNIFSREFVHRCRNLICHSTISHQREHIDIVKSGDLFCDVFGHKKGDYFIIELQPTKNNQLSTIKILDRVQSILKRIKQTTTVQELLEDATQELRYLSGFHRVKAYKFLSDGAGEVVAESRESSVDSFLGLRFPAFDIPAAARKLYATTPIRIIPSISSKQVKILTTQQEDIRLDLSLALFRGVVPVHLMYLKNMKVEATLSLPIVINGQMWGLFAFHHMEEYMLDSEVLMALEVLGSSLSMSINALIQQHHIANLRNCSKIVNSLFIPDESALGFTTYWNEVAPKLSNLIQSDGVGLLSQEKFEMYGACLSESTIRELANLLTVDYPNNEESLKTIAIDSLNVNYPHLQVGEIAGVLVIPNPAPFYSHLFFFRKEVTHTIKWAGNPIKDIQQENGEFRLTPRSSFNEYIQTHQKKSDSFSTEELALAEALKESLLDTLSNVNIQNQHREKLRLIIRELNHRARNILALISSMVQQSKESTHDIQIFISDLEQRLYALSETQRLLTEHKWLPINIRALCENVINPFTSKVNSRIFLKGNDVFLPADLASLLSLIINELLSNATKYGALSNTSGVVKITWSLHQDNLIICWDEMGGPLVKKPTRKGFGTTLIQDSIPYEYEGTADIQYFTEGVEAKFSIPLANLEQNQQNFSEDTFSLKENVDITLSSSNFKFKAFVLEDNYLISKEMTQILIDIGAYKVNTTSSIPKAIASIQAEEYDVAILDVNIRGEFSGEVAKTLKTKNVPFIYVTGYAGTYPQLKETGCVDILPKPLNKNYFTNVLEKILTK